MNDNSSQTKFDPDEIYDNPLDDPAIKELLKNAEDEFNQEIEKLTQTEDGKRLIAEHNQNPDTSAVSRIWQGILGKHWKEFGRIYQKKVQSYEKFTTPQKASTAPTVTKSHPEEKNKVTTGKTMSPDASIKEVNSKEPEIEIKAAEIPESTPQQIHEYPEYKEIRKKIISEWEKENGPINDKDGLRKEFSEFEKGSKEVPSLHNKILSELNLKHPDIIAFYKAKVFENPYNDPLIGEMYDKIQVQTNAIIAEATEKYKETQQVEREQYKNQRGKERKLRQVRSSNEAALDSDVIYARVYYKTIKEFKTKYPEKAKSYEGKIPGLGETQKGYTLLNPEQAFTGSMPIISGKFSDEYYEKFKKLYGSETATQVGTAYVTPERTSVISDNPLENQHIMNMEMIRKHGGKAGLPKFYGAIPNGYQIETISGKTLYELSDEAKKQFNSKRFEFRKGSKIEQAKKSLLSGKQASEIVKQVADYQIETGQTLSSLGQIIIDENGNVRISYEGYQDSAYLRKDPRKQLKDIKKYLKDEFGVKLDKDAERTNSISLSQAIKKQEEFKVEVRSKLKFDTKRFGQTDENKIIGFTSPSVRVEFREGVPLHESFIVGEQSYFAHDTAIEMSVPVWDKAPSITDISPSPPPISRIKVNASTKVSNSRVPKPTLNATAAVKSGANKLASKGISKAVSVINPIAGKAVGAVLSGDIVGSIKQVGRDIKKGIIFVGKATAIFLTMFFYQALIGFIALTALTLWILFFINSGAYIVPPGGFNIPTSGPLSPYCGYGSCPIPNAEITCGSYPDCHGTNWYWAPYNACEWPIPYAASVGAGSTCTYNQISGSVCENQSAPACPAYGFALDIDYPSNTCGTNAPVYFPHLNNVTLSWSWVWGGPYSDGSGQENGLYRASDGNNVYEIYFTHLDTMVRSGNSGDRVGNIHCQAGDHAHIELRINGSFVKPDFLCSGQTVDNCEPLPSGLVDCDLPGPYPANYVPGPISTYVNPNGGRAIEIATSALSSLSNMINQASSQGESIMAYYGLRSYDQQLQMCEDCNIAMLADPTTYCLVAPAEWSQHRTGLAVDLYNWIGQIQYTPLSSTVLGITSSNGFIHVWPSADPPHFCHQDPVICAP
jgi:hypothetical protein